MRILRTSGQAERFPGQWMIENRIPLPLRGAKPVRLAILRPTVAEFGFVPQKRFSAQTIRSVDAEPGSVSDLTLIASVVLALTMASFRKK
jgi:hypothetical protein